MHTTVESHGNPGFAPNSGASAGDSRAQARCGGQRRSVPLSTCWTSWVVKGPETQK